MAGHHGGDAPAEHEIHLPQPSLSPAIISLGVTLLAFGILFGLWLIVAGLLVFLVGLATWLIDDARGYARMAASDADGHGGH